MNTSTISGDTYCNSYSARSNESAAEIIVRVGKACGISPRVLLVMLQKEQSLITDTWPTVRQIDVAMGANCPDTGPDWAANCDPRYFGFQKQVHRAAWLLKYYKAHPTAYRFQAGKTVSIQYAPNPACGSSPVYLQNQATAALYIYTPYQPGGDPSTGCVSYDKTNFVHWYSTWFGSPLGYLLHARLVETHRQLGGDSGALGAPIGAASIYGDRGVGQGFENGSIYWSPDTGARAVFSGGIREKYWNSGSWPGPLGFPSGVRNVYASGGQGQGFQNGSIYFHPAIGGVILQGSIREKYWTLGSIGGTLGYPTGDASSYADGGLGQGFENGSIYWGPRTRAVYIQNPIRAKYWSMGSISSVLGYPTGDASSYADGGLGQGFENGSIYWRSDIGAVTVLPEVRAEYWRNGSITGSLGYPVSDQVNTIAGGVLQEFERGTIHVHKGGQVEISHY